MINKKSNVLNWSNANDFHGSRGPTLRGSARHFYDPSIEAENQLSYCGSTLIEVLNNCEVLSLVEVPWGNPHFFVSFGIAEISEILKLLLILILVVIYIYCRNFVMILPG